MEKRRTIIFSSSGSKMFQPDKNNPPRGEIVKYLFEIQEKIVPELITLAEIRYTILRNVYFNQPIGRRSLAGRVSLSERKVRNELDFLRKKGLLEFTRAGTVITDEGKSFLAEFDEYIKEIKDIKNLEEGLEEILGLGEIIIVPGELEYSSLRQEIGRRAAVLLKESLEDGDILAVTGGETLAQVADSMRPGKEPRDVLVVPGRGGLGEKVEIQANTIASQIAKKLGGDYRLLHIPDSIKKENLSAIRAESSIKKTLEYLEDTSILLHGVGTAEKMATRRGMDQEQVEELLQAGAIGEAFGFYFNQAGEIVYSTTSVGISLSDLSGISRVIAVAGGVEKAKAIISVVSSEYQDILITDELTGRKILSLKGGGGRV
ncbi:MAG: sugar-binding transcriptional regulator [Bacillota bacterium]